MLCHTLAAHCVCLFLLNILQTDKSDIYWDFCLGAKTSPLDDIQHYLTGIIMFLSLIH